MADNNGSTTVQEMLNHLEAKCNESNGILKLQVTKEIKQELKLLASKMEARERGSSEVQMFDELSVVSYVEADAVLKERQAVLPVQEINDVVENDIVRNMIEESFNEKSKDIDESSLFEGSEDLTNDLLEWSSIYSAMSDPLMIAKEVSPCATQVFDEKIVRQDNDPTTSKPLINCVENDDP